jgi:NAD(P)-dependent dehydrogenase (short-subunit alcohol dehydrogenase family)
VQCLGEEGLSLFESFPAAGLAVVVGAGGGIGQAMLDGVAGSGRFVRCIGFGRTGTPAVDLTREDSIAAAAAQIGALGVPLRLVVAATGFLHGGGIEPEKSWRQIDAAAMAHAFAINSIGPALLMKHLLPLLPRQGKCVFAALSAKVGSIGDNRLGGWYSYRASKAALNQLVHTAAIELQRQRPEAICVALHPGTVGTALSAPFAKSGLAVQTPTEAAQRLLSVIDSLCAADSGHFFNPQGERLPW